MSARFRARAPGPVSGQLCRAARPENRARTARVSCCLSAAGVALLGHPVPPGDCAPLTIGLPRHKQRGPDAGCPCSARVRHSRGGRPLYPGDGGASRATRASRDRRLPPCNGWSLSPRYDSPSRDVLLTRHQQGFTGVRPSRPFPSPVTPGRNGSPRAFTPGFTPGWAGPSRACRGGDGPKALARGNVAAIISGLLPRRTHSQRATSRRNALTRCPLEPGPGSLRNSHHPRSEGTFSCRHAGIGTK